MAIKFEKKYKELNKKYRKVEKETKRIKKMLTFTRFKKNLLVLLMSIVFIAGFYYYRHPLIILVGIATSYTDFRWEMHCVKNGIWKYDNSIYMINEKIPINIPVTYFLIGAIGVIYVLFRLGY